MTKPLTKPLTKPQYVALCKFRDGKRRNAMAEGVRYDLAERLKRSGHLLTTRFSTLRITSQGKESLAAYENKQAKKDGKCK